MFYQHVLFIVALVSSANGAKLEFGKCPVVEPIKEFDLQKFSELWYAVQTCKNVGKFFAKCPIMDVTEKSNQEATIIYSVQPKGLQRTIAFEYNATLIGDSTNGEFTMIQTKPKIPKFYDMTCVILDTDYDVYASLYCCSQIGKLKMDKSYIFGRETVLTDEVLRKAQNAFVKNAIPVEKMGENKLENCIYS